MAARIRRSGCPDPATRRAPPQAYPGHAGYGEVMEGDAADTAMGRQVDCFSGKLTDKTYWIDEAMFFHCPRQVK